MRYLFLEREEPFITSNAGLKELKVEICNYLKRRFDLTYDYAKEVLVTVGGSEAIDIALRTMVNPGDEVLIPQPVMFIRTAPSCRCGACTKFAEDERLGKRNQAVDILKAKFGEDIIKRGF